MPSFSPPLWFLFPRNHTLSSTRCPRATWHEIAPLCESAPSSLQLSPFSPSLNKQALSPSFGFHPLTLHHLVEILQEDLPGSLVDKTLSSQCSGLGSIPGRGTKAPHTATKSASHAFWARRPQLKKPAVKSLHSALKTRCNPWERNLTRMAIRVQEWCVC